MDEWIRQGHWWWLLVVPLATGVFALFGSWLGSMLGKTTEHDQWLRNQRMQNYMDFMEACAVLRNRAEGILNHTEEKFNDSHALLSRGAAQFVATDKTREEVEQFLTIHLDYTRAILSRGGYNPDRVATAEDKKLDEDYETATEAIRTTLRKELKI